MPWSNKQSWCRVDDDSNSARNCIFSIRLGIVQHGPSFRPLLPPAIHLFFPDLPKSLLLLRIEDDHLPFIKCRARAAGKTKMKFLRTMPPPPPLQSCLRFCFTPQMQLTIRLLSLPTMIPHPIIRSITYLSHSERWPNECRAQTRIQCTHAARYHGAAGEESEAFIRTYARSTSSR